MLKLSNQDGLEFAKPDLQSMFKKPGVYEGGCLARACARVNWKCFAALLHQVMGSASRARRSAAGSLGTGGHHRHAGRGRHDCQTANEPERASQSQTAAL